MRNNEKMKNKKKGGPHSYPQLRGLRYGEHCRYTSPAKFTSTTHIDACHVDSTPNETPIPPCRTSAPASQQDRSVRCFRRCPRHMRSCSSPKSAGTNFLICVLEDCLFRAVCICLRRSCRLEQNASPHRHRSSCSVVVCRPSTHPAMNVPSDFVELAAPHIAETVSFTNIPAQPPTCKNTARPSVCLSRAAHNSEPLAQQSSMCRALARRSCAWWRVLLRVA